MQDQIIDQAFAADYIAVVVEDGARGRTADGRRNGHLESAIARQRKAWPGKCYIERNRSLTRY